MASSPSRTWRWWWFAAGILLLAVIGGSAAGAMKYFNSRFPNAAEQELLGQVPLALTMKNSCTRNDVVERDTANVQASVSCTSEGDATNTVVFTKFASPKALDSHYQTAVAAAGLGPSSGDCLNAERAEAAYASETGRTSGRTVCYQQRGSSFVAWTDDQVHTLGVATRADPDYLKLRDWWAGVVGLPTKAETEAQAQANKQVEDARKQTEDAKKQAEAAQKQTEDAKKQTEEVQKQAEDAKKQAEDAKKQTEELQKQAEDARRQALAQDSQQQPQNGRRQPQDPQSQDPQTGARGIPQLSAPTRPTTAVKLNGAAPPTPGPQQGGPPMPGTGGCTAMATSIYYACTITQAAPVYLPGTNESRGPLPAKGSPFLCQTDGSTYSVGNHTNHWWAWMGLGRFGVWVPTVFLAGGLDDAPEPGLPVCGSASTTTTTPPITSIPGAPPTAETPPTASTDNSTTDDGSADQNHSAGTP